MQPHESSAFEMIPLILEAAQTVRHKKKKCERLARRSRMIGACLCQLQNLNLVLNPESRKLITSLEETLCQIHSLLKTCQSTRLTYHFSGRKLACQFREVQGKIGVYLIALPNISQVYMASQFAGAAVHAHLAEAQVQILCSFSMYMDRSCIVAKSEYSIVHNCSSSVYSLDHFEEWKKALRL